MAKKPNPARDLAAKYGYQTGGPVVPGNIDLHNRPVVHNADDSISTVRSITVGFGDKTYVLPTVIGDKVVSNKEAIDHFKKTGEHLGAFDTLADAEGYSQRLHEDQAKEYEGRAKGGLIAKYGVEGYAKGGAKKPTDIELAVQKVTGMKPGLDRASILPFYTDKSGRNHPSAPQFLYDAAKAFVVPGVAAQGGKYDTGDVVNMAMNVTGGGLGASHVAGPTVRAGEQVLGMGVKPKGAGKTALKEVEKLAAKYSPGELVERLYRDNQPWPYGNDREFIVPHKVNDKNELEKFSRIAVSPAGKNKINLDWISSHPPREGLGSEALTYIQQQAEKAGLGIRLTPWSRGQTPQNQLVKFYEKHGFVGDKTGMTWAPTPNPAAQDLGAKYGLPEFTTDLTPAQIEANRAVYPTRAYHGTPSAHGEEGAFTTFRDANAGDEYMLDRRLGAHFAKDPAMSNTFLYEMGDTDIFPNKGAHILPVQLPAEHEFLDVDQPLIPWTDPNSPDFRPPPEGVAREPLRHTDQRAIEELVALEAYRRDPDLLARYLVQARNVSPSDAPRLTQEFLKGSEVALPYDDKPRTLSDFLRNYGGNPYNDADRARVVELAREALKEKGYKGLRYYNTSPSETRKAADKTAYIVFDPQRDVKSTMNRGTFDPNDPHLNKAHGGLIAKYGV